MPDSLTQLKMAFTRAVKAIDGTEKKRPTGKFTLSSSRSDAERWLSNRVGKKNRIVIDIETAGGLKLHPSKRELLCLGIFDGTDTFIVPEDQFNAGRWEPLYDLLLQFQLGGHNGKFDTMTLSWYLLEEHNPLPLAFDSQLGHAALYPAAQRHALSAVTEKFYGWPDWSLTQAEYNNMRSVPLDKLYPYLAMDVQGTGVLASDLHSMLKLDEKLWFVYNEIMIPATNMLAWVEWYGVTIDRKYIEQKLKPEVQEEIDEAAEKISAMADAILGNARDNLPARHTPAQLEALLPENMWPRSHGPGSVRGKPVWVHRFNPGSPAQVKKLYEVKGIKLKKTDEETLTKLIRLGKDKEFAPVLLDYRGSVKLMGTYIQPNLDEPPLTKSGDLFPGWRRFPNYKLFGVHTGRTAADGLNIQNQPRPKRIRRMYVPCAEGRMLGQTDYSQAELRVMAAEGEDEWLIGIFADDEQDVFEQMLPMAFPTRVPKSPEERKEMRAQLKGVIYGLSFGRQAAAIAEALDMPVFEAQAVIDNFLKAAKGVARYRSETIRKLHDGTGLRTRFGRYFQHDVITPGNKHSVERSALSFTPQGSVSDCLLLAATDLVNHIRENELGWRPIAFVHDSITIDAPDDQIHEAMSFAASRMQYHAEKWFPEVHFATDGKAGRSWDETG
jgi:DNA polymerase-1